MKKRRKRKPAVKDVRCSVRLIVGGKTAKTIRRRITMAQALREIGGDPVCAEGRLLTGVPFSRKRSIVRGVSVALMYVADHRPQGELAHVSTIDMQGAVEAIRAGVPM